MRTQEGKVKGYQGMDEKRAKETDDGRKEEKDRTRKQKKK